MRVLLALALLLPAAAVQAQAPAQAQAQDRPLSLPTRDVDVTYRILPGQPVPHGKPGETVEQRSRFDSANQRTRLDAPTPGVYSIMDHRNGRMSFVVEGDRASLDTPLPPRPPATFGRLGTDQVAGLPCVEWQTRDTTGRDVVTCVTADGVMLRVRFGAQPLAVATRVSFGPQDPALFTVPAGFRHVSKAP